MSDDGREIETERETPKIIARFPDDPEAYGSEVPIPEGLS